MDEMGFDFNSSEPGSAGHAPSLGFRTGDRVRDSWGNVHEVLGIDASANHGLGVIRTRRLSDGVELGFSVFAHGLQRIDSDEA